MDPIARLMGGVASAFFAALILLPEARAEPAEDGLHFDATVVDAVNSGDCKMAGDIDGDDLPDLVIGGMPAQGLSWYHYPTWRRTLIATPDREFTTDGALGDVDDDGDLDIVVPDGNGDDNLKWFRNPAPDGDPFDATQWEELTIGTIGGWGKDVELADFDGDGRLDVATRHHGAVVVFFQAGDDWNRRPLQARNLGTEGMASGDIDGDGDADLVVRGAWLDNPGGAAAHSADRWIEHAVGDAPSRFKALVADLDGDGRRDLAFSSSEGTADVRWWRAPQSPDQPWTPHTIIPSFERAHTLQAADMDNDGDLDVVVGQMQTSALRQVLVLENADGKATRWQRHLLDTTGLHNGVVVDIGNDGDMDVFGSNWVGAPPVRLWVNRLDPHAGLLPLDRWTSIEVTNNNTRTFGLGFGDLDQDGLDDIIAGRFVYLNPGGDMTGTWQRVTLPGDMHGFALLHLQSAGPPEILAQKEEDELALYALRADDLLAGEWTSRRLGAVPNASHELGAQGYRWAQLHPGGPPEIILSSGGGLYYFSAPKSDDGTAAWRRVRVTASSSDEGVAVGDIDGDGHLDLAATTGHQKGVEWYRNPGAGSERWMAHSVGTFPEAVYPDRIEAADLSGDGRLDLIVTEENGEESDAETFWWEQPATGDVWPRHLLTTQATTNSLDVADFDGDGASDIVTGEHRGPQRVIIWRNDGKGTFTAQLVGAGHESHLGARSHDLDGDGDLDLVSIGYDDDDHVWLWRNDAIHIHGLNVRPDTAAAPPARPWLSRLKHLLAQFID